MISFMSANYLGREKGYRDVAGFSEAHLSIADAFSPVESYGEKILAMFQDISRLGFHGVDLWTAHCSPAWATGVHYEAVRHASKVTGVKVTSVAGTLGGNLATLEELCILARGVGTDLLGCGGQLLQTHFGEAAALLERYDLRLGFENHPAEKTPLDVLEQIRHGGHPRIGATLDTGWFCTHGYPVEAAIEALREHLLLVHLKNVEAPGGHTAQAWDKGYLDFGPIVRKLREVGFEGPISIEYEPTDHDPGESCSACRKQVEAWLEEVPAGGAR